MSINTSTFRELMGLFATGVTVVTTYDRDGVPYGVTVSSFTSVSLDPPLVLICLDNRLGGLERFESRCHFGIHILADDQKDISEYFASPGTDRSFACGYYRSDPSDVPVLREYLALMKCCLQQTFPGGDHTILLGRLSSTASRGSDISPLIYFAGQYRKLDCSSGSESSTRY